MDNGCSEQLVGMSGSLSSLRFESAGMSNKAAVTPILGEPDTEEQNCSRAKCEEAGHVFRDNKGNREYNAEDTK